MRSTIVLFSGRIASGKTTISRRVAAELGWKWGSFSRFIKESALGGVESQARQALQDLGESLVLDDPIAFASEFLRSLGWKLGVNLVLDGLRHVSVLKAIRELTLPSRVLLIYLDAAFEVRQSRVWREEGPVDLRELERHPVEEETFTLLKSTADIVVDSSNDEPHIYREVLSWLRDESPNF